NFSFFFQAEDGIRDRNVTGVQTCALPICCLFAVNQVGHFLSKTSLRCTLERLFFNSLRVLSNFFLVKEGKPTEVINDNRIASVEEVLVPGVSRSLFWIKPKLSSASGLAKLLTLRIGNQWAGQSVGFNPIDASI